MCAGQCVNEVQKETTEKPHENAPDKDLKQLQGSFCELHNCLLLLYYTIVCELYISLLLMSYTLFVNCTLACCSCTTLFVNCTTACCSCTTLFICELYISLLLLYYTGPYQSLDPCSIFQFFSVSMKTGICWNGRKSFGLGPNQNLHRRKHWKYFMLFGADLVIFQPEGTVFCL